MLVDAALVLTDEQRVSALFSDPATKRIGHVVHDQFERKGGKKKKKKKNNKINLHL